MDFFTSATLGPNREVTPEGFLLCRDVVIARTGEQIYAAGEIPVPAGPGGLIRVRRSPEAVFEEDSMASMNGKPITLRHPAVGEVTPNNWSELAKGTVQNVRRGSDELLLADVLITSSEAIEALDQYEIVEVSCGYDGHLETVEPGLADLSNIRYNHLALLPGEDGRCGPVCSIDNKETFGDAMKRWKNRIRDAFKLKDEAALETELENPVMDEEAPESEEKKEESKTEEVKDDAEDPIAALCARVDALEAALAALKPVTDAEPSDDKEEDAPVADEAAEEEKKDEKVNDSAALLNEAQAVFARAEILSPGIALPIHDSKADAKKFRDSLCALKRRALAAAFTDSKTRDAVTPLVAGVEIDKLPCAALHATFVGASELVKRTNNSNASTMRDSAPQVLSVNDTNKSFWEARKANPLN